MPNPKMKSESYQLLGGINQKWSPYALTPMEFLDIRNMDFQTVNSLTERWGSTQFLGQTFPGNINSIYEYTLLTGQSHLLISYSGGIYDGATTGQGQGLSLTNLGATLGISTALYAFVPFISPTIQTAPSVSAIWEQVGAGVNYQGDTSAVLYGTGENFYVNPSIQSDNTLSYSTLNNFLFMADGNKFIKFDGTTTTTVGLPPILWGPSGPAGTEGLSIISATLGSATISTGFLFGISLGSYYLYASYVNNRGFEGPIWPFLMLQGNNVFSGSSLTAPGLAGIGSPAPSLFIAGLFATLPTPLEYGISAINIYCYYDPYNQGIGQTYISQQAGVGPGTFYGNVQARFWNLTQPQLLNTFPASGSTLTGIAPGVTSIGSQGQSAAIFSNLAGPLESTIPNQYLPLGFTISVIPPNQTPTFDAISSYFPRYLETFQGRLFSAGFSATPSDVWFSDTNEPEGYPPANFFEVRTNDGDYITCIKAYASRFYIFKRNSFTVLTGDNPNNFSLSEISDQYGCFNNRCAVIYDDILIFLGQKGVMMWQGAALTVISQKVQPIIDSITYQSALTSACAVHDKLRNQIMFSIPTNGSTTNNLILVYDYLVGAWTKYDNVTPTAMTTAFGYNNTKNAFYGDYNGRVNWFGPSFLADNGVGFSSYIKSRFMHDLGDSTQKMYRRFYLNVDTPGASTGTTMFSFNINFFQDYGSSIVYSTTIGLTNFQNRIDFGISAKSLAFELSNIQGSQALRIHGFTIESRFLRAV